jgi:branched-chain amino acid transport system ATP-binding protein
MLQITDLHVNFGKVAAVRGVTISVPPGQVTLALGANGAGKTSTLRATAGLIKSASGSVTLDGRSITGLAPHKIVSRGVVLVPEGRRVFGPLTVEENLRLGAQTTPRAKRSGLLARYYEMFPILQARRRSAAGLLSGGEQQMLAFARALMGEPRYILMDEPSMGLAPAVIESIMTTVRMIADSGHGVLMVEQNADAGLQVADNVVVMSHGECVYTGPAEEATAHSAVVRAFLGEAALADATPPE